MNPLPETKPVPTLYEWAGGRPAFENLTAAFYKNTRIAVINSNTTGEVGVAPDAPMPRWGWGEPGGPYQG